MRPGFMSMGSKQVEVIHCEGTQHESRLTVEALVQPEVGFFAIDTPIYEGDVVEIPDPRGGTDRRFAATVKVHDIGSNSMRHIEVLWGKAPASRVADVRRLGIEGLHPTVIAAASDLFTDGHYSQAIFEAFKALEIRVRTQSGLDLSGHDLMTRAFATSGPINIAAEQGQSGKDEQEGFRFIFVGVIQGIRNPKGHELVKQSDAQRALEYLAIASVLFRRLDGATVNAGEA
jgi:uncharacterized protein (TIGR02391 family)